MVNHIFKGVGDLVYEGWVRSSQSYSRSLQYYHIRVRDGIQPSTPVINLFDVNQQNLVLLIGNSLYMIITLVLFLYMKRRQEGFRLRWLLSIYDALNVIIASYIACATLGYKLNYGGLLLCNPINNDAEGYRLTRVFVLFYIQKYFEYFDTWFFLLRKSFRQVTFLHLFHHSSITVVVGSILPFDYNGDMYLPILLNSANHAAVYSHYLLTSLGIQSWWSPYITSMQLFQFTAIFAQSLLSYRVGPTCGSPDFAKVMMIIYMGSMVALFANFFIQRYVLHRPYASLDFCGVIKRPLPPTPPPAPLCGTVRLNDKGQAVVILPTSFRPSAIFIADNDSYPLAILLTPIGNAMPNLHVSKELHRMSNSNISFETSDTSTSAHAGAGNRGLEGENGNLVTESVSRSNKASSSKSNSSKSSLHRNYSSLSNLPSAGATTTTAFVKHNDRLIDGPLPSLPSILSSDKSLTGLGEETEQDVTQDTVSRDTTSNSDHAIVSSKSSGQSGKKSSIKTVGRLSNSGRYAFTISGGRPAGKVCWHISTSSHPEKEDQGLVRKASTDDWRTIS